MSGALSVVIKFVMALMYSACSFCVGWKSFMALIRPELYSSYKGLLLNFVLAFSLSLIILSKGTGTLLMLTLQSERSTIVSFGGLVMVYSIVWCLVSGTRYLFFSILVLWARRIHWFFPYTQLSSP